MQGECDVQKNKDDGVTTTTATSGKYISTIVTNTFILAPGEVTKPYDPSVDPCSNPDSELAQIVCQTNVRQFNAEANYLGCF
jgi:hypothetical protein